MKKAILFFVCLCFLCSCSHKEPSNTPKGISETKDKAENSIQDASVFTIHDGQIINDIFIPVINNKVMGIEDEFYVSSAIDKAQIENCFNGFSIALPPTINKDLGIKVVASFGNSKFSYSSEVNEYKKDQTVLAYYRFYSFQNKFWVNPTGKWVLNIYNGNDLLLTTDFVDTTQKLFYQAIDNSPFKRITERSIIRNIDYTFRYLSDSDSVVVVYYSQDGFIFVPVCVLKPISTTNDKHIIIKWNSNAKAGSYYINSYDISSLPTKEATIPLFESFTLQ